MPSLAGSSPFVPPAGAGEYDSIRKTKDNYDSCHSSENVPIYEDADDDYPSQDFLQEKLIPYAETKTLPGYFEVAQDVYEADGNPSYTLDSDEHFSVDGNKPVNGYDSIPENVYDSLTQLSTIDPFLGASGCYSNSEVVLQANPSSEATVEEDPNNDSYGYVTRETFLNDSVHINEANKQVRGNITDTLASLNATPVVEDYNLQRSNSNTEWNTARPLTSSSSTQIVMENNSIDRGFSSSVSLRSSNSNPLRSSSHDFLPKLGDMMIDEINPLRSSKPSNAATSDPALNPLRTSSRDLPLEGPAAVNEKTITQSLGNFVRTASLQRLPLPKKCSLISPPLHETGIPQPPLPPTLGQSGVWPVGTSVSASQTTMPPPIVVTPTRPTDIVPPVVFSPPPGTTPEPTISCTTTATPINFIPVPPPMPQETGEVGTFSRRNSSKRKPLKPRKEKERFPDSGEGMKETAGNSTSNDVLTPTPPVHVSSYLSLSPDALQVPSSVPTKLPSPIEKESPIGDGKSVLSAYIMASPSCTLGDFDKQHKDNEDTKQSSALPSNQEVQKKPPAYISEPLVGEPQQGKMSAYITDSYPSVIYMTGGESKSNVNQDGTLAYFTTPHEEKDYGVENPHSTLPTMPVHTLSTNAYTQGASDDSQSEFHTNMNNAYSSTSSSLYQHTSNYTTSTALDILSYASAPISSALPNAGTTTSSSTHTRSTTTTTTTTTTTSTRSDTENLEYSLSDISIMSLAYVII